MDVIRGSDNRNVFKIFVEWGPGPQQGLILGHPVRIEKVWWRLG